MAVASRVAGNAILFGVLLASSYSLGTVIPISSSVVANDEANAGVGLVQDLHTVSQFGTIQTLTTSSTAHASAQGNDLTAHSSVTATWGGPDQGTIAMSTAFSATIQTFDTDTRLAAGAGTSVTGWFYTFQSDVDAIFKLDYTVAASGTITYPFILFLDQLDGGGAIVQQSLFLLQGNLPVNASGTVFHSLTAGQTYTFHMSDDSNINSLNSQAETMSASFAFQISPGNIVPDSGGTLSSLALSLGIVAVFRHR